MVIVSKYLFLLEHSFAYHPKKSVILTKGDSRSVWIAIALTLKKAAEFLFNLLSVFQHFLKANGVGFTLLFIQLNDCFIITK